MAGHSKGDGQTPKGIYIPSQQIESPARAGRPGSISPQRLQAELQSISQAARVLEQRLSAHQEAVANTANLLQGQISSNDTDISANADDISALTTAMLGKAPLNHQHTSYSDIPGLWDDIMKSRVIPMAAGTFYDTGLGQSGGAGVNLPPSAWQGLYPMDMVESYWGDLFQITGNAWNGTRSIKVKQAGWYFFAASIEIIDAVTQGANWGVPLQYYKYAPSADQWYMALTGRIPPINQPFNVTVGGAVYLEPDGVIILKNGATGLTLKMNTYRDVSNWTLFKLTP
jgi:hypothetical protein